MALRFIRVLRRNLDMYRTRLPTYLLTHLMIIMLDTALIRLPTSNAIYCIYSGTLLWLDHHFKNGYILATTVEYSDSVYTVHNKQEARTSSSCFCNTSLCDKQIYWVKFFCYNYKSSTDWVIATHFFGHSDFRLFAVEWYLELEYIQCDTVTFTVLFS